MRTWVLTLAGFRAAAGKHLHTCDAALCQVHSRLKGYCDIFLEGKAQAVVYFNK